MRSALRRLRDLALLAVGGIVILPLAFALAGLVAATIGRPILFRQRRVGLRGQTFTILKFRTMSEQRDPHGRRLPDSERLSRIGVLLRRTSLDEIPSLWNVLVGEMSLVGPRPLLREYMGLYTERQARRHEVRPGITGWAQVNGRNAVDWATRLEMDVWYVENRSFLLDLKILGMTVIKVLRREGINHPGSATMEPFMGQGANE